MNCSIVVPFYNEDKRILKVLQTVTKVKNARQIIVVDDGSEVDLTAKIKKLYPHITVIRNKKNRGKSQAVWLGIKKAVGKYIFLVDADLKNLTRKSLEKAIFLMDKKHPDMLILKRVNTFFLARLSSGNIIFSGERILKKSDLKKVFIQYKPKGFELEIAINQYMMKHNKKVYWLPIQACNTYKMNKRGFVPGLSQDISVFFHLVNHLGVGNYLKQIFLFAKKEVSY